MFQISISKYQPCYWNYKMDTNDLDLEKVCRVCLLPDSDALLIFDELNSVDGVCISEMINECTIYKVRRFDGYPHTICQKCFENVKISYNFKKLCESSHRKIMDILKKSIPEEVLMDDEKCLNEKASQTDAVSLYLCERCDEKFYSYENLREHRLAKHKGSNNECRICKRSFNRLGHLKSHMSINHPEAGFGVAHECNICNKQFTRKEHLRRHLHNIHKQVDAPNLYDCKKCSTSFKNKGGYLEHKCAQPDELCTETNVNGENDFLHEPEISVINCGTDSGGEHDEFKETNIWQSNEFSNVTALSGDINMNDDNDDNDVNDNDDNDVNDNDNDDDDDENETKPLSYLKNQSLLEKNRKMQNKSTTKELKSVLDKIKIEKTEISEEEVSDALPMKKKKESTSSKKTNNEKRHECPQCNKTFSRSSHVKRHLITHMAEKPFECKICRKTFSRLEHLNNHLRTHSDERPFACEICDRRFVRKEHLKSHCQNRHSETPPVKNEICKICSKGFTTQKYLTLHMRSHLEKKFSCKMCTETFGSKTKLQEHAKILHGNEKPFLCSECGLRFVRNDYLIIHMRRHNGEKPYKCKFCDKGFPRATDLNVHEKYHTGEKPHLCNTCGKGFHRAYNLVVHMRVHTGERPYKCPHCVKSFTQCNDLKAHIRRHTGERFKCEVCGEGFIQGYHLSQHKRNVHGIESFSHIRRLEKFINTNAVQQEPHPQTTTNSSQTESKALQTYLINNQIVPMETINEHMSVKLENNFDDINQIRPNNILPQVSNIDTIAIIDTTDLNTPNPKFYSKIKFEQMD